MYQIQVYIIQSKRHDMVMWPTDDQRALQQTIMLKVNFFLRRVEYAGNFLCKCCEDTPIPMIYKVIFLSCADWS